jgi:sigma-B regulation protein RsbU (phosphoserine phosphatase)
MAITHAIAHAQPGTHMPPAKLLRYLNNQLARVYTRDGTFVTAFYAILDPATRTLEYSIAGHNPPRLVHGDHVRSLGECSGLPLGILDDESYGLAVARLEPGDLVVLYTDGITEAPAPLKRGATQRELFGTERLDDLLLGCRPCSAKECIERIRSATAQFTENAPLRDDQTLIAMRCV